MENKIQSSRASILKDYQLIITDPQKYDGRKIAYYNRIIEFIKRKIIADRIVITNEGFKLDYETEKKLGVDVARFGKDKTIITLISGEPRIKPKIKP